MGGVSPRWVGSWWAQSKVGHVGVGGVSLRWVGSCRCGWGQSKVGRVMSVWVGSVQGG